jgi:hypothetical protein
LNSSLRHYFDSSENLDETRVRTMLEEVRANGIPLDGDTLGFVLRKTIKRMAEHLAEAPGDLSLIMELESAVTLARELPFDVNLWGTQNSYYVLLQNTFPEYQNRAREGDDAAKEWVQHFLLLGRKLSVHVPEPTSEMAKAS